MNPLFSRMTKRYTPPMNREIMEGMAVSSMKYLEEYLDAQIRSVCAGLPPEVRYVSYERCTPQEEFDELTKVRNNRRTFDLANSTVYLVKFHLVFTDQMGIEHLITRFIYLPYVTDAGIMSIGGTQHHIVPVLSDKVFTPSNDSIFVRLMQDRNNMFRLYHTVIFNGVREARYVVWATIYRGENNDSRSTPTTKAKTTLAHYLFGKYGFSDAFTRYAGSVPVFGMDEINPEDYPSDEWVICESTHVKPPTCIDKMYIATKIKLAIRKENWTPAMKALVVGFYYVVDHFPDRFIPTPRSLDDRAIWMILIGHIRFSGVYGENKLYNDIEKHFESLDGYLDTVVQQKLREKGVELENYYDLLNYIQINFDAMIRENENNGLCVYGKNLEVLSYILYDILYGFVMVKFRLCKIVNRRPLTLKDVTENLHRRVRMGAVFGLSSGKIITEAVSYSGDSIYPKVTAIITEQENRAGANRGQSERVTVGPQHRVDLSMVTAGSVLNLPKSNPTPMARVNPWITLDPLTGTVLPNPKFEKLIDDTRPLFKLL